MKFRQFRWTWLVLVASQASAAGQQSLQEKAEARLDKSTVSAIGQQEARLMVSGFGAYSILVKSGQGTGLQIVDPMAGPSSVYGLPGELDGRIDTFLDRGNYKIITQPAEKASGEAQLSVHAYQEQSVPAAPLLVELKDVTSTLSDFQQRSWWLQVDQQRFITLEAAGRSLSDLRLWKDGTWLVDAAPNVETIEPKVGQPLTVCRLVTSLAPGLYLVTAYGGAPKPWAAGGEEQPLYLRYGIPALSPAGRIKSTVSVFGIDRYRVPRGPNYFRLELPEIQPASLEVRGFNEAYPFQRGGNTAEIRKDSALPVAELTASTGANGAIVTVSGPAGQSYGLQHFERRNTYPLSGGRVWLSTVHSGHAADSIDATAILTVRDKKTSQDKLIDARAVPLSKFDVWARRFNLQEPVTLFLQVKNAGTYGILMEGTEAESRIEPFMTRTPEKYKSPNFQKSGSGWDLDVGYYVLQVQPIEKGILNLAIYPPRMLSTAKAKLSKPEELSQAAIQAVASFGEVQLSADTTLYFNQQPGVKTGLILRSLPMDLTTALPLALNPGQSISVPFKAFEEGTVRAISEEGTPLEVSVNGGAWSATARVTAGQFTVAVRNPGKELALASLSLEPKRLDPSVPLPALPESALSALPNFPVLTDGGQEFLDLNFNQNSTFIVRAEEPGLYELQSTGLLATEGNLRTRTTTSLFRESENGPGRNFLIQQYLRAGTYQVTVAALQTQGHLGVELKRSPLIDGGPLKFGVPARIELPAGAAVAYQFTVEKEQELQFRSIGLGRTFRCRLEDEGGWPVQEPTQDADFRRIYKPGKYRVILLPEAAASRRVTLLEPVQGPLRFEGHGPHALPLGRQADHLWQEPASGGERTPDLWEMEVPAPVNASVLLNNEMQGRLLRLSETGTWDAVTNVPAGKGWSGKLEAGRWRLEAVCARINNKVPYQVQVRLDELLAGQSLQLTAPASVPLSVGKAGLIELASFGAADVRAKLVDAEGKTLAENDDRPEDWNFHLLQRLNPGAYRLQVDPVGADTAPFTVSMEAVHEMEDAALALPAKTEVVPGTEARLVPLQVPAGAKMLLVAAQSVETVGCSLEMAEGQTWKTLSTAIGHAPRLEVPLSGDDAARYRLRLWSLDRRGTALQVQATTANPTLLKEADLAMGVPFEVIPGLTPPAGILAVKLERPGVFELDSAELRRSTQAGQSCATGLGRLTAASGSMLWLVTDLPADGSPKTTKATRVSLESGTSSLPLLLPTTGSAVWDLNAATGPLLVLASTMVGQPGIRVVDRAEALAPQLNAQRMAVGPRSAVSVALRAAQPSAVVWAADRTEEETEARLSSFSFPNPALQPLTWGGFEGSLKGQQAASFEMPGGKRQLRLTLGREVVAVLSEGDTVQSVHWAGGAAFEETIELAPSRLTLLHTGEAEGRYSLELFPMDAARLPQALQINSSFERSPARAGMLRIPVEAPDTAYQLQIRGAVQEVQFLGADGSIHQGNPLELKGSGTLLVRHNPGLILGWIQQPGQEAEALWGQSASQKATDVSAPATVPLEGTTQALRFSTTRPVLLHLRSSTPVLSRLQRPDAKPEIEAQMDGLRMDVYVPGGSVEIGLQGLDKATLHGVAELTATEVTPIQDGLGPEVLLSTGATRMYSFEVKRKGPVGLGVQSDSGLVECWLLDRTGRKLSNGIVQMPTLEPGTYLLALHVPETGEPVRARPALAGLVLPDTGPPQDVIREYLKAAGILGSDDVQEGGASATEGSEESGDQESGTDGTDEEGGAE